MSQISVVFLMLSTVALVCRMSILVWTSTGTYVESVWWDSCAKLRLIASCLKHVLILTQLAVALLIITLASILPLAWFESSFYQVGKVESVWSINRRFDRPIQSF